jgi:hypothetical protein
MDIGRRYREEMHLSSTDTAVKNGTSDVADVADPCPYLQLNGLI